MGAWDAGLYSDDTTCDVRDSFVTHLKQGRSGEEAAKEILDGYGESLKDHEVECLVLLSLADTAWKYGRLTAQVRDRALVLIDNGGDMHVWEQDSPENSPLRRKALNAIRKKLLAAQPEPRPVKLSPPKIKRIISNELVGSVFLLPLPSQRMTAMVLVDHVELGEGIEPIFSVIDWCGQKAPTEEELLRCSNKTLVFSSGLGNQKHVGIFRLDRRKNPMKQLEKTNLVLPKLAYDRTSTVFVSLNRIAQEADAQLSSAHPNG